MSNSSTVIDHPLTAIRLRRNWTQRQVAAIVALGSARGMATLRQKVYRWETGRATPEMSAQLALATALGIPWSIVADNPWPAWLLFVDQDEHIDKHWSAASAREVLNHVVQSGLMDRRSFFGLTSAGVVALADAWINAPADVLTGTGGGAVTQEAVDQIQQRVENLWRLDDALGGGGCLDAGVADLRLVSRLVDGRQYTPVVGQQLLGLAGALGRFCGWAAFDAGRLGSAQRFWHAGLRSCAAAGDRSQGVYALSNLALAAAYRGDGRTTLDLLDRARTQVDPAQRVVLAMLDCWSARGHALVGDPPAAAAALHRADTLWSSRRDGDDPPWVYWMPQPSITVEAGTALLHSGDYPAALTNLTEGLHTRIGHRDRAFYLGRLAEAQLLAGQLDVGVHSAHAAVELAAGIDSARVRAQVRTVIDLVDADEPAHQDLVDHEAAVRTT